MNTFTSTPYRAAIDRVSPYTPGKPIEDVARELGLDPASIIKLASNENPLGPSPRAVEAMHAHLDSVRMYPDSDSYALRQALAGHIGIDAEQLIVGRGSDEIMHFLAVAYLQEGDEVVMGNPPFSMYEISTLLMGATPVKIPLRADFAHDLDGMLDAITPRTKLLYMANPHNPTGAMNSKADVDAFMARVPEHVIVVLDEAYYEYVTSEDYPDALDYVRAGKNVLVMRTFSKIYALAGLRVGYAFTSRQEVLRAMKQVQEPFNVPNLGQWAAIASLEDPEQVRRSVRVNEEGKAYLYAAFERLGLPYVPTQSNFILFDAKQPCQEVFQKLLRKGVIIRAGLGYPTMLRVTIGTAEENARVIATLEEALSA